MQLYVCFALLALNLNTGLLKAHADESSPEFSEFSMESVELLFNDMSLPFEGVSDPVFHRKVRAFVLDGRNYADRMLLRMAMYFPYIEAQLEKRNLPPELKYLTITESAVNPNARSRAGAVGLWQIMSGTARHLGLRVGRVVDERRDPKRSTEAALDYLEELFEKYSDWKLALAAYNCGPGRVDQAIRRSGSKDFEVLKRFLPLETRQYIPSFMAATYFGTFYAQHGILALPEDFDLVLTDVVRIFETTNFSTLSEMTGVPQETIAKLNPSFRAGYVPGNSRGYDVILPLWAVQTFEMKRNFDVESSSDNQLKRVFEGYIESTYELTHNYTWKELGRKLYLNPYHLKYLNLHLGASDVIQAGTSIRFVIPKFSGFLVKEINDEQFFYNLGQLEPLERRIPGFVSRSPGPIPPSSPSSLQRWEASPSGTRIRKIYSNRNVPGRGQSLSDVERVENFNTNRVASWKTAFAGE